MNRRPLSVTRRRPGKTFRAHTRGALHLTPPRVTHAPRLRRGVSDRANAPACAPRPAFSMTAATQRPEDPAAVHSAALSAFLSGPAIAAVESPPAKPAYAPAHTRGAPTNGSAVSADPENIRRRRWGAGADVSSSSPSAPATPGDARGDAVAERDELVAEDQLVQGGRRGRRARAGGPHRRGLGPRGGSRTLPPRATGRAATGSPGRARGIPCARRRRAAFRCATRPWRTPGSCTAEPTRTRAPRVAACTCPWEARWCTRGCPFSRGAARGPWPGPRRARKTPPRGDARTPSRLRCAARAGAGARRVRGGVGGGRVKYDFDFAKGVWAVRDTGAVVIARDARDAAAGAAADAPRPASETASETDERAPSAPKNSEASPETRSRRGDARRAHGPLRRGVRRRARGGGGEAARARGARRRGDAQARRRAGASA